MGCDPHFENTVLRGPHWVQRVSGRTWTSQKTLLACSLLVKDGFFFLSDFLSLYYHGGKPFLSTLLNGLCTWKPSSLAGGNRYYPQPCATRSTTPSNPWMALSQTLLAFSHACAGQFSAKYLRGPSADLKTFLCIYTLSSGTLSCEF